MSSSLSNPANNLSGSSQDEKAKGAKKCVIKKKRKFETYKKCLKVTQLENKINHLEKMKLTSIVSFVTKESIKNS